MRNSPIWMTSYLIRLTALFTAWLVLAPKFQTVGSYRPKKSRVVQGISVSGLSSLNRLDSVMIPNQTPDGVNCSSGATSHVSTSLEVVVDPREEVTDYLIFRTSLFSQTCDRGCQILPIVSGLKSSGRCWVLNILFSLSSL